MEEEITYLVKKEDLKVERNCEGQFPSEAERRLYRLLFSINFNAEKKQEFRSHKKIVR